MSRTGAQRLGFLPAKPSWVNKDGGMLRRSPAARAQRGAFPCTSAPSIRVQFNAFAYLLYSQTNESMAYQCYILKEIYLCKAVAGAEDRVRCLGRVNIFICKPVKLMT